MSPNPSLAHQRYAIFLVSMRRFDEAIAEDKRALQLDPLNVHANNRLGEVFLMQGQYDKGLTQWGKSLEIEPHDSEVRADVRVV